MKTDKTEVTDSRTVASESQDSRDVALRALINRAEHLIKEMEFAFDDVPAGVDAQMSMLRLAIADARQQL